MGSASAILPKSDPNTTNFAFCLCKIDFFSWIFLELATWHDLKSAKLDIPKLATVARHKPSLKSSEKRFKDDSNDFLTSFVVPFSIFLLVFPLFLI